jgi:hypothetical protein
MLCTGRPSFCPRILRGAERNNEPDYTIKRLGDIQASTTGFKAKMETHKLTVPNPDAQRVYLVGWRLQSHSRHLER